MSVPMEIAHDIIDKIAQSMCGEKRRHKGEAEANRYARRVVAKGGGELVSYECLFCRGWHVGQPMGAKAKQNVEKWLTVEYLASYDFSRFDKRGAA